MVRKFQITMFYLFLDLLSVEKSVCFNSQQKKHQNKQKHANGIFAEAMGEKQP